MEGMTTAKEQFFTVVLSFHSTSTAANYTALIEPVLGCSKNM
jgi:hypothetical protein